MKKTILITTAFALSLSAWADNGTAAYLSTTPVQTAGNWKKSWDESAGTFGANLGTLPNIAHDVYFVSGTTATDNTIRSNTAMTWNSLTIDALAGKDFVLSSNLETTARPLNLGDLESGKSTFLLKNAGTNSMTFGAADGKFSVNVFLNANATTTKLIETYGDIVFGNSFTANAKNVGTDTNEIYVATGKTVTFNGNANSVVTFNNGITVTGGGKVILDNAGDVNFASNAAGTSSAFYNLRNNTVFNTPDLVFNNVNTARLVLNSNKSAYNNIFTTQGSSTDKIFTSADTPNGYKSIAAQNLDAGSIAYYAKDKNMTIDVAVGALATQVGGTIFKAEGADILVKQDSASTGTVANATAIDATTGNVTFEKAFKISGTNNNTAIKFVVGADKTIQFKGDLSLVGSGSNSNMVISGGGTVKVGGDAVLEGKTVQLGNSNNGAMTITDGRLIFARTNDVQAGYAIMRFDSGASADNKATLQISQNNSYEKAQVADTGYMQVIERLAVISGSAEQNRIEIDAGKTLSFAAITTATSGDLGLTINMGGSGAANFELTGFISGAPQGNFTWSTGASIIIEDWEEGKDFIYINDRQDLVANWQNAYQLYQNKLDQFKFKDANGNLHEAFLRQISGVDGAGVYELYAVIPEPAEVAALLGLLALGFAAYRRRR